MDNNDNFTPFAPRALTRMFSCPSGYEMTEEEQRFDQATDEERANTVWSWTPPAEGTYGSFPLIAPQSFAPNTQNPPSQEQGSLAQPTITTPPREMIRASAPPMAPPRLSRQETMAAPQLSREMTITEPPMAPPRLERQETRTVFKFDPPPPPVLTRQTATGVSNTNPELPPSRLMRENTPSLRSMCVLPTSSMATDEPPRAPPRFIREDAIEPIYRKSVEEQLICDLRVQMTEMHAQMTEMRAQMTDMHALIVILMEKIETKK